MHLINQDIIILLASNATFTDRDMQQRKFIFFIILYFWRIEIYIFIKLHELNVMRMQFLLFFRASPTAK